MKYHISNDGIPRRCNAKPGHCPIAPDSKHYETTTEARKAFEDSQEKKAILAFNSVQKELDNYFNYRTASYDELNKRMELLSKAIEPYSEDYSKMPPNLWKQLEACSLQLVLKKVKEKIQDPPQYIPPGDWLTFDLENPDPEVRASFLDDPDFPKNKRDQLIYDPSPIVRSKIAGSNRITETEILILMEDSDAEVRKTLAKNSSIPSHYLRQFRLSEKDPEIKDSIKETLLKHYR